MTENHCIDIFSSLSFLLQFFFFIILISIIFFLCRSSFYAYFNIHLDSLNVLNYCIVETLERLPPTTVSGLIGSSLVGAAAVMGGAMDNLLNANANNTTEDQAQKSSASGTNSGGGLSSLFNLKSVVNSVAKPTSTPTQQSVPSTSNFFVSSPATAADPMNVELQSNFDASLPQKSVQGIIIFLQ